MSNDSPSPDSNLPKKSSSVGKSRIEGTELDLWDFDSEEEEPPNSPKPNKKAEPSTIPSRRVTESPIQSKKPTERHIDPPNVSEDEPPTSAPAKKKTAAKKTATKQVSASKPDPDQVPTSEEKQDSPTEAAPETKPKKTKAAGDDESNSNSPAPEHIPNDSPNSWKSIIATLSKAEKIGISALVVILVLGATLSILHFSNKVPTRSILGENLDLPVEGKLVKVTELSTYWRKPITTGGDTEVVRRGTKLIPVLKISAEAKSAAIRVLFRNEDGSVIGDPINRTIKGKSEFRIPATAGFDDIGMHAAYRTGESPPWIIQILEASESGLSIEKFKLVLETEISTDIH
ncbi:MAG: hypothetical protein IZT59_12400 [Verrucomicrobia bacterium]|nr:hypothetical protein [Verrucomicrobiota bacterium]|tara:strand:- start:7994 stop:9028 length:1035 start_codon:yes stop_codon:yes gene_type:complete